MPSSSHGQVIQVSNVSQQTSREQMYTLFSFLGRVADLKLYPTETNPYFGTYDKKICYVKFDDSSCADAAQHLTNTVLIDRALVIVPYGEAAIPDEASALRIHPPIMPGHRHMPSTLVNQISTEEDGTQVISTVDPVLASEGLPPYPNLAANTDAGKIEEIRRTVYLGDIPKEASGHDVVSFLTDIIGEVMYMRFAGDDSLPTKYAYVEFAEQGSIVKALNMLGKIEFHGSRLRIQHSNVPVVKPSAKTAEAVQQEIEEAMAKANEKVSVDNGVRSSRSPSRYSSSRRSRSRDRSFRSSRPRRSRSRSPARRRGSRSRSKEKHRRSSPRRKSRRSSSRGRDKKRSKSADRKRKDRKRGSRSRSKSKDKKKDSKSSKSGSTKDREKNGESSKLGRKSRSKSGSPPVKVKKESYGPVLPPSAQPDQPEPKKVKEEP